MTLPPNFRAVTRAWLLLLALSAGSTLAAAKAGAGPAIALGVLALAGLKARIILADYLGLRAAPGWQRGFDLGLSLLILTFAGLALAA